jgi:glycosyltransferase involved in cell wall biosynthesis
MGRLAEIKQHDLLIRAFARVRSNCPEAHLVIIGDGPLKGQLSALSSRLGLDECVHLVGYQQEPHLYLRALDLFCLTSRSEGTPLVILEAWAARVPVVASRVGGVPELVKEGRTGLLFCSGDEQGLAEAISKLIGSTELRVAIAAHARGVLEENYTLERMSNAYCGEYLRLTARGPNEGRTYG